MNTNIKIEDALIFQYFLDTVNRSDQNKDKIYKSKENRTKDSKKNKIKSRSLKKVISIKHNKFSKNNSNQRRFLVLIPNKKKFKKSNNDSFVCIHCDAKYIYKRCLINHLEKNHINLIKIK